MHTVVDYLTEAVGIFVGLVLYDWIKAKHRHDR